MSLTTNAPFHPCLTSDSSTEPDTISPVCNVVHYSQCDLDSVATLLFDLSDLSHGLLEDCAFVRLDIEAVDVGEVGRDELS